MIDSILNIANDGVLTVLESRPVADVQKACRFPQLEIPYVSIPGNNSYGIFAVSATCFHDDNQ